MLFWNEICWVALVSGVSYTGGHEKDYHACLVLKMKDDVLTLKKTCLNVHDNVNCMGNVQEYF